MKHMVQWAHINYNIIISWYSIELLTHTAVVKPHMINFMTAELLLFKGYEVVGDMAVL